MAKSNFDDVMREEFAHEGGYVNHRSDPGGETKYGISKRSYPNEDIKGLTIARAKFLYQVDFWEPIKGDLLPAGVDLVTMDASVNSGKARGVRWTQQAAGLTKANIDGKMGPHTIRMIDRTDPFLIIKRACSIRMGFLRGLKTWGTFGKGWSKRVASVEAVATRMAAQSTGVEGYAKKVLARNADSAANDRLKNTQAGHVTTAGGAAGTGTVERLQDLPPLAIAIFTAAIVLLAIWFYGRSRHDANRAAAYRTEMEKVI